MRTSLRLISGALVAILVAQVSACGTIFYPERRGQIGGKVDPVVVAADAIGILFFVIPGLIALAIDFTTGAIYLPGGKSASIDPQKLQRVIGVDGQVDHIALQHLLELETGERIQLNHPQLTQRSINAQQLASLGLIPAA